jgi:hypothetical protein
MFLARLPLVYVLTSANGTVHHRLTSGADDGNIPNHEVVRRGKQDIPAGCMWLPVVYQGLPCRPEVQVTIVKSCIPANSTSLLSSKLRQFHCL